MNQPASPPPVRKKLSLSGKLAIAGVIAVGGGVADATLGTRSLVSRITGVESVPCLRTEIKPKPTLDFPGEDYAHVRARTSREGFHRPATIKENLAVRAHPAVVSVGILALVLALLGKINRKRTITGQYDD